MSSKIKFFISHTLISLLIALIVTFVVYELWYPGEIASAEGITNIILMLIMIDIIVGPVLGFFVYKEGKKTLKMDLMVIIALQLISLGYGVYSIGQSRPVWIVQSGGIFQVVRANMIDHRNLYRGNDELKSVSYLRPKLVAVDEVMSRSEMLIEPALVPDTFIKINKVHDRIIQRSKPLSELVSFNNKERIERLLSKYPNATSWLPLRATQADKVVLISNKDIHFFAIVDLKPW